MRFAERTTKSMSKPACEKARASIRKTTICFPPTPVHRPFPNDTSCQSSQDHDTAHTNSTTLLDLNLSPLAGKTQHKVSF
jgi:hypothetical protein